MSFFFCYNHFMKIKSQGFTLIELLVVIALIGILASVILAALNSARLKARNAKRLETITQIQTALDLYYTQYGVYPTETDDTGAFACGGWDATADGVFIQPLVTNGFLQTVSDAGYDNTCGNYAYYRYAAGTSGCSASQGAFYILGVRNMEGGAVYPNSPGFSCPSRNWQGEFQWVTGKFEN
jgi:prepilin-type N-terminal cleavage/methylation domain-containing protein